MIIPYKSIFFILIVVFFSGTLCGQIRSEGSPLFFPRTIKSAVPRVDLPKWNSQKLKTAKNSREKGQLKLLAFAYMHKLNLSTDNSGRWDTLANGRRVWRLTLASEGAYSLAIVLSKFHLPSGAQLFLYNQKNNSVLGAYTSINNKIYKSLFIEPIKGEEVTLEYLEPQGVDFIGELEIGGVFHDYLNVFKYLGKTVMKNTSGDCNVNVNCPEGFEWRKAKNSVCRIIYTNDQDGFAYLGTGALINNVRMDGKPYLMTAHHVFETASEANNSVFYFNYESETCEGSVGDETKTISGSNLLATTDKLDFTLVELTGTPPPSYNPYYSGWDRTGNVPLNTTCIHHPQGDVKKISMDFDSPVTGTYDDGTVFYDPLTHWVVLRWDLGTTEGGSSGSPLFDEKQRIIGDLTGGDAFCGNSVNDFYAKFSASWDDYPEPSQQLKYWLDPDSEGVFVLDGFNPYSTLFADFSTQGNVFCVGDTLEIVNLSQGDPMEYIWDFGEGATPQTFTGEEPPVVSYASGGDKLISLTIREGDNSDVALREIRVEEPPQADFSYRIKGLMVSFSNTTEFAASATWNFGDGATAEGLDVEHNYFEPGLYAVRMVVGNVCGENSKTKLISTSYDDQIILYPNPGNGMVSLDLSRLSFNILNWTLYNTQGAKIGGGLFLEDSGTLELDLTRQLAGVYMLRMVIDGVVVTRKIVLL